MSEFASGVLRGLSFVVRNTSPQNKTITIFGLTIFPGQTANLLQIAGISEDDIKTSISRGDLGNKLANGDLTIISSTINFESTDAAYNAELTDYGLSASTASAGGGVGNVANIAALTAISDPNELDGTERLVNTVLAKFVLDKTSTETVDNITVVATKSGTGRWLRNKEQHPRWTKTLNWYVDPVSGSDENSGTTSNAPLKNMREVARRITGFIRRDRVNVNLLGNITDANDVFLPTLNQDNSGTLGAQGGAAFPNFALCIQGVRTTATFTDPNTSSATALTMTSAALAPSLTSGTGGLPGIITVSGFDFTPHIGKFVEVLTSGVSASVGAVAVIVAAPSSGVAWISPLTTWSQAVTTPAHNVLTSGQYPGSSSTFRIYTTTTYAPHVLASTNNMNNGLILYQDVEFSTSASAEVARGQSLYFNGCTFKRVIRPSAGGEMAPLFLFTACSWNLAAPSAGRTPTQIQLTSGEWRLTCCGIINCDFRVREGHASCIMANSVLEKSMISIGGPGDAARAGPTMNIIAGPGAVGGSGANYGVGFFNWPSPDLIPPSAPLTRSSSGAAVHIGHGARISIGNQIYGSSSNPGTVGVKVQEGAVLCIGDTLTANPSPVNPPAPYPAYVASSLKITGADGDFYLDGYTTDGYSKHITYANLRGVLSGTVVASPSLFVQLKTWADWEDPTKFNRHAKSLVTGACIVKVDT